MDYANASYAMNQERQRAEMEEMRRQQQAKAAQQQTHPSMQPLQALPLSHQGLSPQPQHSIQMQSQPQQPQQGANNQNQNNQNSQQFTFSLETPSLSSGTLDKYLKSVLGSDSSTAIPDLLKPAGLDAEQEQFKQPERGYQAQPIRSRDVPLEADPEKMPSHQQHMAQHPGMLPMSDPGNQQLATIDQNQGEMIPMARGQAYVDITEYLNMPQSEAAKKLGIPPSTLSKRWKEAVRKRKWPYRMICKIDKEIMTLLHNVPQGPNAPPLPEEIENALGTLLRKRQDELRPVVIRI